MIEREIFEAHTRRKTEWDVARKIIVKRRPDGCIHVIIYKETEWDDAEFISKLLTADEAERLGHALLCSDETFNAITERAEKRG